MPAPASTCRPSSGRACRSSPGSGTPPALADVTPAAVAELSLEPGSQVWVADTGPQTGQPSLSEISVISTATDKVTSTFRLPTDPREIVFSPSGTTAYVTTGVGLLVINTATHRVAAVIPGLGNPEDAAVSPDGTTVYVTNTAQGVVDVISARTNRVTGTIKVG